MKNFVKNLRKNMTEPEKILWHYLRNKKFSNCKFRRQVQIGRYIVDFVSYEKHLVIELDGREHLTHENIVFDKERTLYLNERTFEVIRYYNSDILNNIDKVLEDLWNRIN